MISPSKDKIDEVCASVQEDFNIEDDVYLNKYLRIDMERHPYGSIHLRQPDITQITLNMLPVMYKSRAKLMQYTV